MKIRMLITQDSSPDGIRIETYEAGKKYDFPDARALAFIAKGWAEEDKDMGGAHETKEMEPPGKKGKFLRRK